MCVVEMNKKKFAAGIKRNHDIIMFRYEYSL